MENKIGEALIVITTIASFLGLLVVVYFLIQIVICDYKALKRNEVKKDRYRKMEDKFKNRKLTD